MDYKLTNISKKKKASSKKTKSAFPKLGCINLSIPPLRKGSRKKKFGDTIPIQRWHELHTHPEILLREVTAFLRPTNREIVDTLDRLYVAETSLHAIIHAINIIFNKYLQNENFPESETQREYLSFAIDAIQQINTAFKRIFKQEHESFNSSIKLVQDRVRHAGFRILELTQIEQRLLALSYQKLPDVSWRDLNQVFYVHWFYNSHSQQRKLSGCLKLKPLNEKTSFTGDQPKTPLQLYLTIQLFGLVDGNSLPNKIQHIIDTYLIFVDYRIPITEYDGENLIDGQLIISHNQSKSPQFKVKDFAIPALQLDIFDLWIIIKKDAAAQERINGGITTDNISSALATLSETDRTPFVETIIKQLRYYSRQNSREHIATSVPLRIYVGFSDCHKAMQHKTSAEKKKFNQGMELMQILSENSSSVSVDKQRIANEPWYLVDESKGGLRIRTQTTKFTTKTSIGQIIAFNSIQEKSSSLKLGFITRILRLNEKEIDISVVKMNGRATSIVLQDEQHPNKKVTMIGFFMYLNGSYSQLLLPNSWKLKPHQCLEAHIADNQQQRILIKSSSLQQREFTTYEIALL